MFGLYTRSFVAIYVLSFPTFDRPTVVQCALDTERMHSIPERPHCLQPALTTGSVHSLEKLTISVNSLPDKTSVQGELI